MAKTQLPKKSKSLSDWYNTVIFKAKLCDYGPSKGTMIIRPYAYAIWEEVQKAMDLRIKDKGVKNAYFPIFIPEKFLKKEKSHVEGFSPELAVVTIGGGEELEEKLIVRPTSETIMYDAYSRWIQSYRDLPVLINQWNNVVRWEKRTYMFLRTTEFLWQEGHTAHATQEEDLDFVIWAINMYRDIYKEYYALDGYIGIKSESEKFAGALTTYTFETLMPDGKSLQSCTSHDLGQNFSKAFDIKYQNKEGDEKYVWQTSWGFSTRSLGGLFMAHGDDDGLILPPKLAPTQVIIIPFDNSIDVLVCAMALKDKLIDLGIKVDLDDNDTQSFGYKINEWEIKGVPVRVEIGKKELKDKKITIVGRLDKKRFSVDVLEVDFIKNLLEKMQKSLLDRHSAFLKENTRSASSYEEFKDIMRTKKGYVKAFWCENKKCESQIKEETKATTRCLPIDSKEESGECIYCKSKSKHRWLFAQAY